ncbi:MAG TPA: FapA family protein [Bacilli bacterium]
MSKEISEDEIFNLIKQLYSDAPEETKTHGLPKNLNQSQKGWAKVEDNKIIYDLADNKDVVMIKAVEPVQLRINGSLITKQVSLELGDKVEWDIAVKPMYNLQVSDDKMYVYFHLISLERYSWNLIDKESTQSLVLEAEEDRNMVLESVTFSEILTEVGKMAITKNLKPTIIYQELRMPTFKPIVIAHGLEPTPSQDARLELFFSEKIEQNNYQDVGGTIDFRNHLRIPSAKMGDVIARKIPMVEGAVGYDVFGNIVKPSPPNDVIVVAKDHVMINEAGEVIAQKEGRPRMTGQKVKYFDINPSYVVTGDVDLEKGNIVFSGDIIIYGNVLDGMIIESMGNVYIMGSVYKATITATGSIIVSGNIVASSLYSGYFGVIFNRLYMNTKKLNDMLTGLIEGVRTLLTILEAKGKEVSFGQILMILVESKYKELTQTVVEILASVSNMQNINADEMTEFKTKIMALSSPLNIIKVDSINYILDIHQMIQEIYLSIERTQEGSVLIDIHQCHLSNLKSNGDALIRREGVLQSNVYAKGNIIFYGSDSVCRGSQLEAGGTISAMQVGGETGGECTLKAGKKIMFSRMSVGKVCIGKVCKTIDRPLEHMMVYFKNNGLAFEQHS